MVKLHSLRSNIYTIFNWPLPSLVWDAHHLSNLISPIIIQCTRHTSMQTAPGQLKPLRDNFCPPGTQLRRVSRGSMKLRNLNNTFTLVHVKQWESHPEPNALCTRSYALLYNTLILIYNITTQLKHVLLLPWQKRVMFLVASVCLSVHVLCLVVFYISVNPCIWLGILWEYYGNIIWMGILFYKYSV